MKQTSKKTRTQRTDRPSRAAGGTSTPDPLDLSRVPIEAIRLEDLQPQSRIAPHFRWYELTRSETAERQGIDNRIIEPEALRAAIHLARNVLEPIREAFGSFSPNSVFRSQALERALKKKPSGWFSRSQHTLGQACDLEIVGMPTLELAKWAQKNLPAFDQIICECYNPAEGPNSGWVHISLLPPGAGVNRGKTLSYIRDSASGRLVYVEGLQASVA